jgi:hypothetical protein
LTCASGLSVRDPSSNEQESGGTGHGPNSALGFCFLNSSLHSMVKNIYGERAFFGVPLSFLLLVFFSCTHPHNYPAIRPRVDCKGICISSLLAGRRRCTTHGTRSARRFVEEWNCDRVPLPGSGLWAFCRIDSWVAVEWLLGSGG